MFVALIDTMQTISASVAIQQVSWRQPRAVDFRAVQGAVAAAGVAKLLAGLLGTVPNTTHSTTVSVTELTGVGDRRLLLVACKEDGGAVLEFVTSTGEENLQDRIALLGARINKALVEQEVSLRLLQHLASSVRHQQYHGTDIVTIRVETP